ncbi:NUDIX hydrolase [Streptomyces sp. NPDC004838]
MTDYERLRAERPELFGNETVGADGIDILFEPGEIEAARRAVGTDEPVGVVYEDRFVTLLRDAVRFPGGELGLYIRLVHKGAGAGAVILPIVAGGARGTADGEAGTETGTGTETGAGTETRAGTGRESDAGPGGCGSGEQRIVLIEHYRHATRRWHWEAPRGMGAPGDGSGADSARRELWEELGALDIELIPLGTVHADTGLISGGVEMYAARIAGVGALDVVEGIRRAVARPWGEVERMIASGEITDGFTIAAFTRARLAGVLTRTDG